MFFLWFHFSFFGFVVYSTDFIIRERQTQILAEKLNNKELETIKQGDLLVVKNGKQKVYPILGTGKDIVGYHVSVHSEPGTTWLGSNRDDLTLRYLKKKKVSIVKRKDPLYKNYYKQFKNS